MVRIELEADASLAAIRARSRLGMAIEAMIRMMVTTISNSISENPRVLTRFTVRLCSTLHLPASHCSSKMADPLTFSHVTANPQAPLLCSPATFEFPLRQSLLLG